MSRDWFSWVRTKISVRGESYKSLQAGLYFPDGIGSGNSRKRSHTAVHGTKQEIDNKEDDSRVKSHS